MAEPYRNSLSIREEGYLCVRQLDPSRAESGFQVLKGRPALIAALPEVAADRALRTALEAMNGACTRIFSVACANQEARLDGGHQLRGYVEFALNSRSEVQDAINYFPVFAGFDRSLRSYCFRRAEFDWQLSAAEFVDAGVSGFTCNVNVRTDIVATSAEARADWQEALCILGQHLGMIRWGEPDPIYEPPDPLFIPAASALLIANQEHAAPAG